jgi:predicted DNA-binding transcriptional regulator AlpA
MPDTGTPPATRYISWQQLCQETDPDFFIGLTRPWIYEFSNGRLFVKPSSSLSTDP